MSVRPFNKNFTSQYMDPVSEEGLFTYIYFNLLEVVTYHKDIKNLPFICT